MLRDVSYWLSRAYAENIRLTGIIYLHRITDTRMGGVALKNLTMFKKLCGEDSFSSVVLATTFWEDVDVENGNRREMELRTTQQFYGAMLRDGSMMMRHTDNTNSAMSIVSYLVNRGTTTILNIQRELDRGKRLDETAAGAELEKDMIEQKNMFNKRLSENEEMMQQALRAKDEQKATELAAQQEELNAKINAAEKGREELRVDMERLFQEKEEQIQKAMTQLEEERNERQKAVIERAKELKEWQNTQKQAEELFEKKRKEQEDEIRGLKAQNQKVEEAVKAQKQQFEEKNREMEENLRRAKDEEDRRQAELLEAQTEMVRILTESSQRPELYQGDPPDYSSVIQAAQMQAAMQEMELQTQAAAQAQAAWQAQAAQAAQGSRSSSAGDVFMGAMGLAAAGAMVAAPAAMMCSIM